MILQPIDWHEHDVAGTYVIDVFGRCEDKRVICVRLTGFRPYFFTSEKPDIFAIYEASNKKWVQKFGPDKGKEVYAFKLSKSITENPIPVVTQVKKYDTMSGFNNIKYANVWKVEFETLASFKASKSVIKCIQYESNLPPFLRFFHEKHLGPASPLKCNRVKEIDIPETEESEPMYYVNAFYTCAYTDVEACDANIPLLVASYDLEMCPAGDSNQFPVASKDPIIQIGVSYRRSTDMITPTARVVFVLGEVAESGDDSVEFVSCETEEDMLLAFAEEIRTRNPDILCGYNIFGFDDAYIEGRIDRLGIRDQFEVSRMKTVESNWGDKKFATLKTELAAGKFDLRFLTLRGRLGIDLLLNMRREHNLDNFKLDHVAFTFLRDKVLAYADNHVTTKSTRGLRVGNYVRFELVGNTNDPVYDGEKFEVWDVSSKGFRIRCDRALFSEFTSEQMKHMEWSFSKDDVSPREMFELHRHGGPEGRARVARYCIQDCDLVATLMGKLDTIVNARGMADVCKVPMQFVLTRGQGIKIFSAVVYYASQRDQIIQTMGVIDGEGVSYEGAIVLPPKIGMYLDQPVSVLDFNSLYPTNMIAYNLSPDTWAATRTMDNEGFTTGRLGLKKNEIEELEAKGYVFEEIEYDNKEDGGKTVCTFVQYKEGMPMTQGVLPKTLEILLKKRKEFKQKMEDLQYDEAQRSVFNGLQLAYKVVANSVYGQAGARTSPIRNIYVAACTTSAGRRALQFARSVAEGEFGGDVVYGDTDSIFVKFPTKDVAESIQMGIACGASISRQMRRPYKIAYEKTFYPFILFCRKRYVGMKYEEDPNPAKAKRMTMGVVLKRRDNAPIVKDVFGGALDVLLLERDIQKSQEFVKDMLVKILENKVPLEKFILSKSLRDDYAAMKEGYSGSATLPAHRVLADRMEARDPGTAPKVGDRVQFVYVAENKHKAKQGDRIEHVDFVRANKLKPDVNFYVTNQIQNPVAQLFALCIEQLDGFQPPRKPYRAIYEEMLVKHKGDEEEATLAVLDKKALQLESIMFLKSPRFTGQPSIAGFFRK